MGRPVVYRRQRERRRRRLLVVPATSHAVRRRQASRVVHAVLAAARRPAARVAVVVVMVVVVPVDRVLAGAAFAVHFRIVDLKMNGLEGGKSSKWDGAPPNGRTGSALIAGKMIEPVRSSPPRPIDASERASEQASSPSSPLQSLETPH